MKRLLFIIIPVFIAFIAEAQEPADTSYWSKGGNININFTQVSLTNWAAGGQNSVAGVGKFQYNANYTKENISWDNMIDLGYGLSKVKGSATQKNEDIFDLQSKLGIAASKKWNYSALLAFKSQFAPGYSDASNTLKTSNLLAPANITLAFGMDYKPSEIFAVMIAPITGKLTIVNDPDIDATNYGLESSDAKTRMELGASIKAILNTNIAKNVGLSSELGLFSNYIDNPQNVDVDWKVGLNMKINDYLSAQIDTRLLYDADIKDPADNLAKIQFKQLLGIGLNIKL